MKLVFASTNPHKLREVREILAPLGIAVDGLDAFGRDIPEPAEAAATLEGNARIKALGYARTLGRVCLADDSGLEVDALGGAPGVHSARYAGIGSTRDERDRANREKLLKELRRLGEVNRSARLVCTLCLADAAGRVLFEARGAVEARIANELRPGNGFGYDALLFLPEFGKHVSELTADDWNLQSHRGIAVRALAAWLVEHPLPD
jgi:XTP/dITP diphosphohydrolase